MHTYTMEMNILICNYFYRNVKCQLKPKFIIIWFNTAFATYKSTTKNTISTPIWVIVKWTITRLTPILQNKTKQHHKRK